MPHPWPTLHHLNHHYHAYLLTSEKNPHCLALFFADGISPQDMYQALQFARANLAQLVAECGLPEVEYKNVHIEKYEPKKEG